MVSEVVAASTQDWMYEELRLEELSPCRYIKIDTVHVSVCVCLWEREGEMCVSFYFTPCQDYNTFQTSRAFSPFTVFQLFDILR